MVGILTGGIGMFSDAVFICRTALRTSGRLIGAGAHAISCNGSSMRYWLMKSEPEEAGIDHLVAAPHATLPWTGVRNYQARNFMRDAMQVGDGVLFYHSSCPEPGIAGLAQVASSAYPDPTQFDPASPYYDPKSSPAEPRWLLVDVRLVRKTTLVPLAALRAHPELSEMRILARGNRLSITPVSDTEWQFITQKLIKQ